MNMEHMERSFTMLVISILIALLALVLLIRPAVKMTAGLIKTAEQINTLQEQRLYYLDISSYLEGYNEQEIAEIPKIAEIPEMAEIPEIAEIPVPLVPQEEQSEIMYIQSVISGARVLSTDQVQTLIINGSFSEEMGNGYSIPKNSEELIQWVRAHPDQLPEEIPVAAFEEAIRKNPELVSSLLGG